MRDWQKPHALILAGGKSSRFGGIDKGLVEWRRMPLVEHVAGRLQNQVSGITISCNRNFDRYQEIANTYNKPAGNGPTLPACIADTLLCGLGPLAGIYSFLQPVMRPGDTANCFKAGLFICGCDSPLLPKDIVARLQSFRESGQYDAAYPCSDNSEHWLNLLVDVEATYPALENLARLHTGLADNSQKVRSLSIKNWLSQLRIGRLAFKDSDALANINSPADLQMLGE